VPVNICMHQRFASDSVDLNFEVFANLFELLRGNKILEF
jgi:hypothetical protein